LKQKAIPQFSEKKAPRATENFTKTIDKQSQIAQVIISWDK